MVNAADDMTARAEIVRAHNYAMAGLPVPPRALPPAPAVTSARHGPTSFIGRVGTRVRWQGAAGAASYTVQRAPAAGGPWTTVCDRCATDVDDGYADHAPAARTAWYRVIPYNLDGRRGPASRPVEATPA
jgi:hypothetical protein